MYARVVFCRSELARLAREREISPGTLHIAKSGGARAVFTRNAGNFTMYDGGDLAFGERREYS